MKVLILGATGRTGRLIVEEDTACATAWAVSLLTDGLTASLLDYFSIKDVNASVNVIP